MPIKCIILITEDAGQVNVHTEIPPGAELTMSGQLAAHLDCMSTHLMQFKFTEMAEVIRAPKEN